MERASRTVTVSLLIALIAAVPSSAQPTAELSPLIVDSLAPLLATLIEAERDKAKALGVEPIPPAIRAALEGYVPEDALERVRWREGSTALSLPQNVIRFEDVPAMTLDDVIVFQARSVALEDPKLWAHELAHVMQFKRWGISEFAMRYLRDYEAVEEEAWEFRWQFMKEKGLVPPVPAAGE